MAKLLRSTRLNISNRAVTTVLLRVPKLYSFLLRSSPRLYLFLYCRIYKPLVDHEKIALLRSLICRGDSVVDIGANVGFYTFEMCRLVGSEGRVFAFECDPRALRILESRLHQASFNQVTLFKEAISNYIGVRDLYMSDMTTDSRLYKTYDVRETVTVTTTTLDEKLAGHDHPISFIKVDIQGCETAALIGARQVLSSNPNVILLLELYPSGLRQAGSSGPELFRLTNELGFIPHRVKHNKLIRESESSILQRCGENGWTDVLFAKAEAGFVGKLVRQ